MLFATNTLPCHLPRWYVAGATNKNIDIRRDDVNEGNGAEDRRTDGEVANERNSRAEIQGSDGSFGEGLVLDYIYTRL